MLHNSPNRGNDVIMDMDSRLRGNDDFIINCTAVILAGGQSKRMGQDKASLLFEGQTLLARAEQHLTPLFEHVLVSVRKKRHDTTLPQILDNNESRAPMMGIKTALETVNTDWVFVIACDMPFISTGLIHHLAGIRNQHDAVVPLAFGWPQPLFGFYNKTCLPMMETRMKQGQRSMVRLLNDLDTCQLSEQQVKSIDPELKSLLSLDTFENVKKVENIE